MLDRYCVTCHNARLKTGDLVLEGLSVHDAAGSPEIWEKVIRKVRAGVMPPQGAPRPPPDALGALATGLETALDRAAAARPFPGRPLLHRLNRAEYQNAIRDLLDLEVDAATLLPPDDSAYGFDNISDVLGVSPYAAGAVSLGGGADQCARGGRSGDTARQRHLSRAAGPVAEPARGGPAAGHRGRPARAPHVSARRRVPVRHQAVSHQPEHRAGAAVPERVRDCRGRPPGAPGHDRRHRRPGPDVRGADRHRRRRRAAHARPRARAGRPARRDGGVHRPHGGQGRGAPAAVPAGLGRQLRLGRLAAHPDVRRHRAVRCHRAG